jgi:hypothetical protein
VFTTCDKEFSTEEAFLQHIQDAHRGKWPVNCIVCHRHFDYKAGFKRHFAQAHTDLAYTANTAARRDGPRKTYTATGTGVYHEPNVVPDRAAAVARDKRYAKITLDLCKLIKQCQKRGEVLDVLNNKKRKEVKFLLETLLVPLFGFKLIDATAEIENDD